MYDALITSACLASVVVFAIVFTMYASSIRKDMNTKLRSIVDQVNTSQYYQYELEKKSYDKLNTLDNTMSHVRSKYLPRDEIKEYVVSKSVNGETVRGNLVSTQDIVMRDGVKIASGDKQMNVDLPMGGSFSVRNSAKNPVLNAGENGLNVPAAKIDKLQLGSKFSLSGVGDAYSDDNWLRLFDSEGKSYAGGLGMANLFVKDGSKLNVVEAANISVSGELKVKGGASEHNPGNLDTYMPNGKDGKNYVRGDTEVLGNTRNVGDLNVERNVMVKNTVRAKNMMADNVKLGHNFGGWYDQSPLTVHSKGIGASFGNEHYSHFGWTDGNTYIRPSKTSGSVVVGDKGSTKNIVLGDGNTVTKVQGSLCVKDTCVSATDMAKIKQTADDNLLKLQQALQEKLAQAQVQIQSLAAAKANEQITAYTTQQQIREKTLLDKVDELTKAIQAIKVKIGM